MKRWIAIFCAAAVLLSLCGCRAAVSRPDEKTLHLFYPVNAEAAHGGDIIDSIEVSWEQQKTEEIQQQVRMAVELLLSGYSEQGCISPIPQGTRLQDCSVNSGMAWLDFSEGYGQLSGMDLSVADYCITLTLSQIPGVYMVHITVNGQELAYRDKNVFVAGDVLLTSAEDVVRMLTVRLYFPNSSGILTAEERVVTLYEGENPVDILLEELLGGPENGELLALLPEGFAVQTARLEDGTCYVNLPDEDEALLPSDADSQRQMLQGMANSLCSLEDVEQVQFLYRGELQPEFGMVDVSRPFRAK